MEKFKPLRFGDLVTINKSEFYAGQPFKVINIEDEYSSMQKPAYVVQIYENQYKIFLRSELTLVKGKRLRCGRGGCEGDCY